MEELPVIAIRLSTGELIMGTVNDESSSDETLVLNDVVQLYEMPPKTPQDLPQMAMVPYMPFSYAQETTRVNTQQIVVQVKPQDAIKEKYIQAFDDSKIIKPEKSGLILPE